MKEKDNRSKEEMREENLPGFRIMSLLLRIRSADTAEPENAEFVSADHILHQLVFPIPPAFIIWIRW